MDTYVYFIQEFRLAKSQAKSPVKIGIAKDPDKRLACMQTGNASELKIIAKIGPFDRDRARLIEKAFHGCFAKQRIGGEWFSGKVANRLVMLSDGNIDSFLDASRVRRKSRHSKRLRKEYSSD